MKVKNLTTTLTCSVDLALEGGCPCEGLLFSMWAWKMYRKVSRNCFLAHSSLFIHTSFHLRLHNSCSWVPLNSLRINHFSVSTQEFVKNVISNQVVTASFHILVSSLFTAHMIIRCCVVGVAGRVIKETINRVFFLCYFCLIWVSRQESLWSFFMSCYIAVSCHK
jgi:hypothetical protein